MEGTAMKRAWMSWAVGVGVAMGAAGCKKPEADKAAAQAGASIPAVTVAQPTAQAAELCDDPFRTAVVLDPPLGEQRPPDQTIAGKNVARIFEQIAGNSMTGGLWDQVRFPKSGKLLARVKTDQGDIVIELWHDVAPRHVRNFVALAKSGYFDGLKFHRSTRQEQGDKTIAYLEGGCPLGTGEYGNGSIGYWLKPEIKADLKHDEGTVGAWSSKDPESGDDLNNASTKFYMTLNKAPWMDGQYTIFGRIVQGMDVAHTINRRPVHDDDFKDRPKEPVLIRSVTIETGPAANLIAAR
jgi:cyclophilin family peptidyl-prolyl cis-trans isomerase